VAASVPGAFLGCEGLELGIVAGQLGTVLRANRACEEIYGCELEGVSAGDVLALAHPDDRQLLVECSLDLIGGSQEAVQVESRVLHSGGHYVTALKRQSVTATSPPSSYTKSGA